MEGGGSRCCRADGSRTYPEDGGFEAEGAPGRARRSVGREGRGRGAPVAWPSSSGGGGREAPRRRLGAAARWLLQARLGHRRRSIELDELPRAPRSLIKSSNQDSTVNARAGGFNTRRAAKLRRRKHPDGHWVFGRRSETPGHGRTRPPPKRRESGSMGAAGLEAATAEKVRCRWRPGTSRPVWREGDDHHPPGTRRKRRGIPWTTSESRALGSRQEQGCHHTDPTGADERDAHAELGEADSRGADRPHRWQGDLRHVLSR